MPVAIHGKNVHAQKGLTEKNPKAIYKPVFQDTCEYCSCLFTVKAYRLDSPFASVVGLFKISSNFYGLPNV